MTTHFYLQQGHGMQSINIELAKKYPGIGVILSPRNNTPQQVERHARELQECGAKVLFDPQCYFLDTKIEKITSYPYWNFASSDARKFCGEVISYQVNILNVAEIILPGLYTNTIDKRWLDFQHEIIEKAAQMNLDRPVYATLALGPDVILNSNAFNDVLNEVVNYHVDGVYIVLAHPNNRDFITEDRYIYNILVGLLSIALSEKTILIGYANQQSLVYAAAGAHSLASGNFRNVRSFDPEIFKQKREQTIQQRSTWYYDPNTLSEFRKEQLTLAYQRGLKDRFGPVCEYCRPLLEEKNPSRVPWNESQSHLHYLNEIQRQWLEIGTIPVEQRANYVIELLETAWERLNELKSRGFYLGTRSFEPAIEPTVSALTAFITDQQYRISMLKMILG